MRTVAKKLYEAMFLVDSAEASSDWDGVISAIKNILERADAEVVSTRKWDERRLAYEINGKTRGAYILCCFRAEGGRIRDIERDVQLSERIMRVLILSAEWQTKEDIEKETPAMRAEKGQQKLASASHDARRGSRAAQVSANKTGAKRQSALEPAKAEESEVSAKPVVAEASESEQPEQAETKDFEQTKPGEDN